MLSKITGTGDGSAPVVNLTFPYISKDHIKATVDGVAVDLSWTGASQVTFVDTVDAGGKWAVFRDTPSVSLVDFTDGSFLTETDLDLAQNQLLYLTQEAQDSVTDVRSDIPEMAVDAVAAALVASPGTTVDYDDAANTFTIGAPKGDPGGNIASIGTYTEATTAPLAIPAGTKMVRTSGYAADGDGGDATFFYSALAPADGPKFQDASGRWFGIARTWIKAGAFGALEGVADAGPRLNEFFAFAAAHNDVRVLELTGSLTTATPVVYDNLAMEDVPRLILWGGLKLTATAPMSVLLKIKNAYKFTFSGVPSLFGTGGASYASRTVDIGLWVELSARATFSGANAYFFRYAGVYFPATNSTLVDLGNVSVNDSGSGQGLTSGNAAFDLSATWSNPVNSGSTLSTGQRTTIDVSVLPAVADDAYGRPTYVDIGGELFQVMTIDRVNSKLSLHPWVPSTAVPGTLTYIFGGAVSIGGGDNSVVRVAIDAKNTGIGLFAGTLYSPLVRGLVTQNCAIGLSIADNPTDAHTGGRIDGLYCENNRYDINRGTSATVNLAIGSEYALNFAKVVASGYPRDAAGGPFASSVLDTVDIFKNGIRYPTPKISHSNKLETGSKLSGFSPTLPRGTDLVYRRASWNIEMGAFDDQVNKLFGLDSGALAFMGTSAADGAPSGAFVFKPKLGDKINALPVEAVADFTTAGSWASFTVKGPVIFLIYRDVATKTWYIYPIGGTLKGAAVADPAALTSVNGTNAVAAPTKAEFDALVAEFNKLRTDAGAIRTQLIALITSLENAGVIS